MSPRPTDLLIQDILEAIGKIEDYTGVRNLEIIGEAASSPPADFTSSRSDIFWRQNGGGDLNQVFWSNW